MAQGQQDWTFGRRSGLPTWQPKKSINFKVLQAEEYEEEVECLSF